VAGMVGGRGAVDASFAVRVNASFASCGLQTLHLEY
jgi:hypothetical protein